jgi:hypothetical protein
MIAKRIPTILPPLTLREVIETTDVHSICGLLNSQHRFVVPSPESKEAIGGYFVLKAHDLEEAVEIAKQWPVLEHSVDVEVQLVAQKLPAVSTRKVGTARPNDSLSTLHVQEHQTAPPLRERLPFLRGDNTSSPRWIVLLVNRLLGRIPHLKRQRIRRKANETNFPSFLEPRWMAEKALTTVIQEAYVQASRPARSTIWFREGPLSCYGEWDLPTVHGGLGMSDWPRPRVIFRKAPFSEWSHCQQYAFEPPNFEIVAVLKQEIHALRIFTSSRSAVTAPFRHPAMSRSS